jgi:hypothetical protein
LIQVPVRISGFGDSGGFLRAVPVGIVGAVEIFHSHPDLQIFGKVSQTSGRDSWD